MVKDRMEKLRSSGRCCSRDLAPQKGGANAHRRVSGTTSARRTERQVTDAQKEIDHLDSKWNEFVQTIKAKFEHQRQGYIQQRKVRIQLLEAKTAKLVKVREEVRKVAACTKVSADMVKPTTLAVGVGAELQTALNMDVEEIWR